MGAEWLPIDYCQAFVDPTAVLAMRYNSLVFALGLDVPAAAIDCALGKSKVDELAKRFHVPYRSLDELSREFLVDELMQVLTESQPAPRSELDPQFSNCVSQSIPAYYGAGKAGGSQ